MAFKPKGIPSVYQKNSSGGGNRMKPTDILLTIDSYDLGKATIHGTDSRQRKVQIVVSSDSIARNRANKLKRQENPNSNSEDIKWEGYCIDERMFQHLSPGHLIIADNCTLQSKQTHGGEDVFLYQTSYIVNPSDPSPNKTIEGLLTIAARPSKENPNIQRAFHVQLWEETAIDVSDNAAIERICAQIQEGHDSYINKDGYKATTGIQFRVILPNDDPETPDVVVNTSPTFDWISKEEIDGVTHEGRPLDSQSFLNVMNEYIEYAQGLFPESQYPAAFVELTVYKNYMASTSNKFFIISNRPFDNLNILASTPTRLEIGDNETVMGKNYAVKGILQLSKDSYDSTTHVFKQQDIANRIHANGLKGHVHAWVRSHKGKKTVPHQDLKQIMVDRKNAIPQQPVNAAFGSSVPQSVQNAQQFDNFDSSSEGYNPLSARINEARTSMGDSLDDDILF